MGAQAPRRKNTVSPKTYANGDAMNLDTMDDSEPIMKPLRDTADRVGREVEIFAEKLDQWKSRLSADPAEKVKAAVDLVKEYRIFASDAYGRLKEELGAELQMDFLDTFKSTQGVVDNKPGSSGATADTVRQKRKAQLKPLKRWDSEWATWLLLERMLEFYHPNSTPEPEEGLNLLRSGRFEADGQPFYEFVLKNSVAKERLVVLKWLEEAAESTGDDIELIEEGLEEGSERGRGLWDHGWLDTREKLKGEKRTRLWAAPIGGQGSTLPNIKNTQGTDLLVTQLDPDAATRQERKLESSDSNFETSFWTVCWELFRRGTPISIIREWCGDRNQFARAQSMGTHHSDGYKLPTNKVVDARLRWRRTCRYAAKNGGMNAHERAIYGLLSGDYKAMEPVLASWNDYLYANINALLLSQYESYILKEHANLIAKNGGYSFGVDSGNTLNEDPMTALKRIIASFQLNPRSRISTLQPYKCIQSCLIMHSFEEMVFRQGVGLSRRLLEHGKSSRSVMELIPAEPATYLPADHKVDLIATDPHILRVMAHMLIIFQFLGYKYADQERQLASENIIAAYIDVLRQAKKLDLLPVYASSLSKERAEVTMARVLPAIINPGERMEYIQLIKSMEIDVHEVLVYQYEFAVEISTLPEDFGAEITPFEILEPTKNKMWPSQRIKARGDDHVEWEDEYIIRSMEWWPLVDGEWTTAFSSLTEVARRFLCAGRLNAFVELFERLPFSSISTAKTLAILGKELDILEDDEGVDENDVHAFHKSTRSSQMRESQSSENEKLLRELLKVQSRTYVELGQMVEALKSMWRWRMIEDEYVNQSLAHADSSTSRQSLRKHLDELVTDMEPIMGDYLTHHQSESEAHDLKAIREAYLPQLILAFHSALQSAAFLISRDHALQSLDLANDVAANEELTRCFVASGRMGELVDAFALGSMALLDLNEKAGGAGGGAVKKRRGRQGETLAIWDLTSQE